MRFQGLISRVMISAMVLSFLFLILLFAYVNVVKWLIVSFTIGMGSVAIWEYGCLAQVTKNKGLIALCITIGALVIFGFFASTLHHFSSNLPFIFLFIGLISICFYHFTKISHAISSIAKSLFGICYVAIPLGLILKILYLYPLCKIGGEGRIWVIYLLVVTKITDVGAYFGGHAFGKRKLAPSLSPYKTIEGAVIGFILAIVCSFLFYLTFHSTDNFYLTWIDSLYLGVLLGCLGQIGDVVESLLKRNAGVKDSNCWPGLGGVLDMLDSLLFTTPIIYFFLYAY